MINHVDKQYINLINRIFEEGQDRGDRTGTGTRSVFGHTMKFNVSKNAFPILTLKKTHFKSVLHELLWFISGDTNVSYLSDKDVTIWDEWADEDGELGPVYGKQWRDWDGTDQLQTVIDNIKTNPDSRRHIVSAWNVSDLDKMNLVPCHYSFQFDSRLNDSEERELNLLVNQRSVDTFLGLPFNISSYALLLLMVAQVTDHVPGELVWNGGDVHIYHNHFDQVKKVCEMPTFTLPVLEMDSSVRNIDDFEFESFELKNYQHGPYIKAPIAV